MEIPSTNKLVTVYSIGAICLGIYLFLQSEMVEQKKAYLLDSDSVTLFRWWLTLIVFEYTSLTDAITIPTVTTGLLCWIRWKKAGTQ